MKVLVIEGQPKATDAVISALEETEFAVVRGLDRDTAQSLIHRHDAQLLVLVALPFKGWQLQLLRDLRAWQYPPRCLAVTADEPSDVIALLEAGADAYCMHSLLPGLFISQLVALSRRVESDARDIGVPDVVHVRELTIDFARCQVKFDNSLLALTPAEFRIIACLARRAGRVVNTANLFQESLGYETSAQQSKDILKVHVRRIRNKIVEAGGTQEYIVNSRGFGYLLERRARRTATYPIQAEEVVVASTAS